MAKTKARPSAQGRIKNSLTGMTELDIQALARPELGPLTFEDAIPHIEKTMRLFNDLDKADLDCVPAPLLEQIADHAEEALAQMKAVQDFAHEDHRENAFDLRDSMVKDFETNYLTYFNAVTAVLGAALRNRDEPAEGRQRADQARQEVDELLEHLRSQSAEAETNLEAMKSAAGQSGVAQHSTVFEEEAEEHEEQARKWLKATIGTGLFTITAAVAAVVFWLTNVTDYTTAQSVQLGLGKLAVFSVLYYGLIWCGRNYQTHRHNYTVNKHRQGALGTFEAFVSAATDEQTKNAVLLQATYAIFGPQSSGYVSQEGEGGHSTQILEIMRSVPGQPVQ